MIIKKYTVNDMKEAIIRAKYELGTEAVIISERNVKIGKWYNPFKKKMLEVTVALEENLAPKANTPKVKPIESIKSDLRLSLETEPTYKKASDVIKDKLVNYCELHDKGDFLLNVEEKKDFISRALKDNCFEKKLDLSKINVFIGPTGVGKTTTIAKIAAKEHLINKKKVGLITMDTYRIGAVEQLRTYANILEIPFEVVNQPSEMELKINKLSHCDIILIDTLGTSPNNKEKLDNIKEYLNVLKEKYQTYLVLSISTDKDNILSILERYKLLNYNSLILTKFDEVNAFTNFWSIIENNKMPVQYFCHGQDVPDDIKVATLDNLLDYFEENYKHA